jgi:hypothetical protein
MQSNYVIPVQVSHDSSHFQQLSISKLGVKISLIKSHSAGFYRALQVKQEESQSISLLIISVGLSLKDPSP